MVDPIGRIWFEVCGKKNYKRKRSFRFCAENPIEGKDGKKHFLNEDILNIELGAWKMYFVGAVNQYGNGIGVLLITPNGSHVPLAVKLNFEETNNMIWGLYCWNGSSSRVRGKRGRSPWRFDFSHSLSIEIMEGEGRALETLSAIYGGFNQNIQ